MRGKKWLQLVAILLLSYVGPIYASNGINPIGYGARSSLVAGADIAFPQDSLTININPAGLTGLKNRYDAYIQPFYAMNSHQDKFAGEKDSELKYGGVFGLGFLNGIEGLPLTSGTALLVQGGVGFSYNNIKTPFDTIDDAESMFTSVKLSQSFAWRINEQLSFGLALSTLYSEAEVALYPGTSFFNSQSPEESYFGLKVGGTSGYSFGGNLGVLYKASPSLTFGVAYMRSLAIDLEGGYAEINYASIGEGKVIYKDASVNKMSFPDQLGIGMNYRFPSSNTHFLAEISWVDWSSSIDTISLRARNPNNNDVPEKVDIDIVQGWRDQYVLSTGVSSQVSEKYRLLAGINYARSQIPDKHLNAIFAAAPRLHATIGVDVSYSKSKSVVLGLEYQFHTDTKYTNNDAPYGPNARERNGAIFFHIMLSGNFGA